YPFRLRPLAYPGTHVFLVCYSAVERSSFENVTSVWLAEIRKHCPNVPFVLCGTKIDLLEDEEFMKKFNEEGKKAVSTKEGEELAKKTGAYAFCECSGKTQKGMREVFQKCVEAGLIFQGIIEPPKKTDTVEQNNKGPKKKF